MSARDVCDSEYREAVAEGVKRALVRALPLAAFVALVMLSSLRWWA